MYESVKILESNYKILKKASEKSHVPIVSLVHALVTKEINWLNNPEKIGKYFSMVKEGA